MKCIYQDQKQLLNTSVNKWDSFHANKNLEKVSENREPW